MQLLPILRRLRTTPCSPFSSALTAVPSRCYTKQPPQRLSSLLAQRLTKAPTQQPRRLSKSFFTASPNLAIAQPMSTESSPPPVGASPPRESYGNFDLVQRVKLDHADISLEKWTSRKTGLSVVHLDYESPLVKGYFVVGTEIFNDSGCPHTLEHLVFLGSEQYPYKGVLDNLANRAFSNGTNAWTATDHTAYTIATAGQQGFLQLLPVYVDHILYPTITDNGFVTEVHHVNGKAEDAGVVYAEMQGREQTSGDLMALKLQRLFYPNSSAYRSETGGLMEALRVLTPQQIRDYHNTYYVPHNLCLVVSGKLSSKDLLDVLQTKVEPGILEHGQAGAPHGWKRPFMETPSFEKPTIKQAMKEGIEFPEKDESMGELCMAHVGPDPSDFLTQQALDLLSLYLTDGPVAPLTKEFVEIPSPLCTYIYFMRSTRASFVSCEVYFGSVPTGDLETLDVKFKESLRRIAKEGLDMDRMKLMIKRERLKLMNALETDGGDYFSNSVIEDFLYGAKDGSELGPVMADVERYQKLQEWTSDQWSTLLAKYYIDQPAVIVHARPSASLPDKIEADEKARIAAQREKLGPDGLAKLEKKLDEAKKEHERPIPKDMLTSFPVPDTNTISWIPVQTAKSEPSFSSKPAVVQVPQSASSCAELQSHLASDPAELPFTVNFDHVQSNFVTISAYLSTADLPASFRPFVNVYLNAFYSLPVTRPDGTKLTHEEVVNQLDNDTVEYDNGLGVNSYFSELVRLSIKVEVSQYATAIAWMRDLLFSSEFTKERLEVTIAKIQQSLPEQKRDGNTVCGSVSGSLLYDETSTSQSSGITTQMEFIPKLAKGIHTDPERIIHDFEEIRRLLTNPKGLRLSVTGNVLGVSKPRSAWLDFRKQESAVPLAPVPWSKSCLSTLGKNPVKKGVVVTLPAIESSFGLHTTKSISGFDHPEYPALRIACEVLDGTESFFWRQIRGTGLAYGSYMGLDIESGLLSFSVYRSPDSAKAFDEARKVVQGLVDGSVELEDTVLDGAKSSLVYNLTKSVSTLGRAATISFMNGALKEVSPDHTKALLAKLQAVTIDDVKNALRTHALPLFDPATSVAVVVSSPAKAGDIADALTKAGFEVERRTLDIGPDEDGEHSDEDSSEDGEGSEEGR